MQKHPSRKKSSRLNVVCMSCRIGCVEGPGEGYPLGRRVVVIAAQSLASTTDRCEGWGLPAEVKKGLANAFTCVRMHVLTHSVHIRNHSYRCHKLQV